MADSADLGPGPWPVGVAALVPVYDHAATVGTVVVELRALGAPVLVVDDGSRDGSGAVAASAGAELLALTVNRGKGAALQAGLERLAAQGWRQAVSVDADGQHPVEAALAVALTAAREPAALVIGERDLAAAPLVSRGGRRWSDLWVRLCCGIWPGDSQCGLRSYPLPAAIRLRTRSSRYAWEIECLVRACWAGIPLRRVPVPVRYPAGRISHFRAWSDNLRISCTFARLFLRSLWPLPPVRSGLWRTVLRSGLSPGRRGAACALGAALAIAPLPGFQGLLAGLLAWLFRLNLPLTLLANQLSLGPLLAVWGAACAALGRWLVRGEPPFLAWTRLRASGLAELAGGLWTDWALGWLILAPLLAAVAFGLALLIPMRDQNGS